MPRIGVTGHMNITSQTVPLIYEAISRILATYDGDLIGVSCIARGADSVFAEAVLDAGGTLEVVLPSRNYRERKVKPDHVEQYDQLLERATLVHVMDFDDIGREAYEAANEAVFSSCDRLIAVWDGQPSVDFAGTASVVKAVAGRIPVDIVWPEGAQRR